MATELTHEELLDFEWDFGDKVGKLSIRHYLQTLLTRVWNARENFDGKRPFGSSSWEFKLYAALIAAKAIDGELSANGWVDALRTSDRIKADDLVVGLIATMCKPSGN